MCLVFVADVFRWILLGFADIKAPPSGELAYILFSVVQRREIWSSCSSFCPQFIALSVSFACQSLHKCLAADKYFYVKNQLSLVNWNAAISLIPAFSMRTWIQSTFQPVQSLPNARAKSNFSVRTTVAVATPQMNSPRIELTCLIWTLTRRTFNLRSWYRSVLLTEAWLMGDS